MYKKYTLTNNDNDLLKYFFTFTFNPVTHAS